MTLTVVQWGGSTMSDGTGGTVVDIWSCMLAVERTGTGITDAMLIAAGNAVSAWHTRSDSGISSTERLEYLKANDYSLTTGHQIDDPTRVNVYPSPYRGAASPQNPVTACYRVSLGNGTRNRRQRGGFYPPRCADIVPADGRWSPSVTDAHLNSAVTLIEAINAIDSGDWNVAIWSRAGQSLEPVSQVRVSDVPDDISRRKSAMHPTYSRHNL